VTPQFCFGHGLSYSSFRLHGLRCTPSVVRMTDSVEVSILVDNESAIDGEAVLFLFVRDPLASISRPLLELKGVQRIALGAGKSGSVNWRLPVAALAYVGAQLEPLLEPGRFEIHVGQSADPGGLVSCSFDLLA